VVHSSTTPQSIGRAVRRPRVLIGLTVASLALAGLLTGCTATSSTGATTSHAPLTIYSDNPAWKAGFIQAGQALKKVTGRALSPVSLPSTANYQSVVQASLSTQKPGDIIKWWNGKQLQQIAATGNLTDLTSVWNADVKKGWLNNSLKPLYSYKGKVYALPLAASMWVVFYNKAVFKQYNLSVPKSYSDLTADAAILKSHGVTPIWTGQADQWTSFIPYQALVGSIDPAFYTKLTNNQATFGDSTSVKALTDLQTWIKKGWTTPPDSKFADAPALLASGKVAMFPIGSWDSGALSAAGLKPETGYGAFFFPPAKAGGPQAVFTEDGAWAVPKNAPDHAAAMTEISHWLDPSVQKGWSAFIGDSSANPTVLPANPVIKALDQQNNAGKPVLMNRYYESFPPSLVLDSTDTLDGFMVNPDTLATTVTTLKAQATKDWAAWNAK
jgi:multiple sugar transport system substrate-binding protein